MNDVLYHAANTFRETKAFIASAAVQYLTVLVRSVKAAPNAYNEPLDKIIKLWSEHSYFSPEELATVAGEHLKSTSIDARQKETERPPLQKPRMLGTTGDPHWLLPVSCMLQVIVSQPPSDCN
jgi:CID domain